jgi:hypothetical protein
MTSINTLLAEIRTHLQAGAISYSSASAANDVYEGFLFALIIATARDSNATISYENVHGTPTTDLIFRTNPGRIYSTAHDYTHAIIRFGPNVPTLEAHVGVFVKGTSGVQHECDVAVVDALEAQACRNTGVPPRASKCLLAVECKYYLSTLPLGVARGFAGLKRDFAKPKLIFASNNTSDRVNTYLNHHNLIQEFRAIPGSREVIHLRTHIREAFKSHVSHYDPSFNI